MDGSFESPSPYQWPVWEEWNEPALSDPCVLCQQIWMEKTLESPMDCKEIQPVHPKGDQPRVFFGRNDAKAETPVLWPPHAKS